MRETLNEALKVAMKAGDKQRVSTIRMITSAIKDRDIAARTGTSTVGDAEILDLCAKLIKSREESARLYDEGGRPELAENERAEITIIREFMPRQMDEAEVATAIGSIVAEIGASGIRDMGKVMAALKERYSGRMDFGKAGAAVKAALG